MSFQYIPKATRRRVAKAAYHRCGYCLTPQSIIGPLLEIDHIIPEAHGGSSVVAARQLWVTAGWHPPADSIIAE